MSKKANMKPRLKSIILVIILNLLFFIPGISKAKKKSRATIPVRIISHGIKIKSVSPTDLIIQENNQSKTITDIKTVTRKIGSTYPQSRIFILLLQVYDYNNPLKNTLKMIYERILREQDQLIVQVHDKSFFFQSLSDKDHFQKKVNQVVTEQIKNSRFNMEIDLKKIEAFISYLRKDTQRTAGNDQATRAGGKIHRHYYMKYFFSYLERYLKMIQDYNKEYLLPRLERYYFIFNQIRNSEKEKWIIHIHQMAKPTVLSKKNRNMINKMITDLSDRDMTEAWYDELDYAKKITKIKGEINNALKVATTFPTEEIIELIYKIKATFYSIYLEPSADMFDKNTGFRNIYANLKTRWETIADRTGGMLFNTTNLKLNIEKILAHEDIIFLISFIKDNSQITGKVKMTHINQDLILGYDSHPRLNYMDQYLNQQGLKTTTLKIENFSFKQNKLNLAVSHFQMKEQENQISGHINVRILIKNKKNQIQFDQNKNILTKKDRVKISINLGRFKKGYHHITAEVTDLVFRDTVIETLTIKSN
jgi:hypothetical protein